MARILVVDDDQSVRLLLRAVLERRGYSVVEAENGKEGLQALSGEPTDVVITDIQMPGMDGLEMILELRGTLPTARIIAMSGEKRPQQVKTFANIRLRSRFVWRNYWTPCSSSSLHRSLDLWGEAQYSVAAPNNIQVST